MPRSLRQFLRPLLLPFRPGFLFDRKVRSAFSSDKIEEYFKTYADSIGVSVGSVPASAFNEYEANRINSVEKFTAAAEIKDEELQDKINAALEFNESTINAKNNFERDISNLNSYISNPDSEFTADEVLAYLHSIKNNAVTAIEAQHQSEITKLEECFADEKNEIPDSSKMVAELKEAQQKELNNFTKSINESITRAHQYAQAERDRIIYLALMYEHNTAMLAAIDDAYEARKAKSGKKPINLHWEEKEPGKGAILKGISIKNLQVIKTLTDKDLIKTEKGGFALSLPSTKNPLYYKSKRLKLDMQSLACALRACGYDAVTLNLNCDEKKGMEVARAFYLSAIEVGIQPEDIKININGQPLKVNVAAKEKDEHKMLHISPQKLQAAQARYQQYKEIREKSIKSGALGEHNFAQKMKKMLKEDREEAARRGEIKEKPAIVEEQAPVIRVGGSE